VKVAAPSAPAWWRASSSNFFFISPRLRGEVDREAVG
jgi:hypothetical protein